MTKCHLLGRDFSAAFSELRDKPCEDGCPERSYCEFGACWCFSGFDTVMGGCSQGEDKFFEDKYEY